MATSNTGARLGTKIAHVVSIAIIGTQQKLVSVKHQLALAIFHTISNVISEEVHDTLGPMLRQFHADLPEDSQARDLLNFMAHNRGQLQALAGTALTSGGILASLAQIVNNELAASVYANLASNPHLIPDAGTITELYAKGTIPYDQAVRTIAENGIAYGWADPMLEAAQQVGDTATMLEFLRRGLIDDSIFQTLAQRAGIRQDVIDLTIQLRDIPLSPADAALAVLRGNISTQEGYAAAAKWGVSNSTFDTLIGNTGEPLALMQLLEAYRRGFIDKPTLDRGILQSRIRDEWIPVAEQLRFSPMSVSDAVNAAVQNHLDQNTAASISEQNGLEPGAFDILFQTAGEPLSRTEMGDLVNRGLATTDQQLQALRESRLKDKYGPLAVELNRRLLEMRELSDAVVYGAVSLEEAIIKAMEHGLNQDDATIAVTAASNRRLETQRKATVAAAETEYVNGALDKPGFTQIAHQMGFADAEINAMMIAADLKRESRLKTAAVGVVRSKYIARHIDTGEASSLLDSIGVLATERDPLLKLWGIERQANVRRLTPAQVVKAVTDNYFTRDQGMTYLLDEGYSQNDATFLLPPVQQ